MNKVNFDDYANDYESITQRKLLFFNKSRDYFDFYKISICKNNIPNANKILDYGCGIGLCAKHLKKLYPTSNLYGTDLSKKSMEIARDKYEYVKYFEIADLNKYKFDLIFVAGVFHHVNKDQRLELLKNLINSLNKSGHIIVFEHNPYNPITKNIVSNCVYDAGVELLKKKELNQLFFKTNLEIVNQGYCLFFPSKLSFFRKFESHLKKIPIGGQYYMIGKCI